MTELMIALAIAAVLLSIAIPSYRNHVLAGRRADAITSLLMLQAAQEKWRVSDHDYATLVELDWTTRESAEGHYQLRLTHRDAAGFRLEAIPKRDGPVAGDSCGTFALTQNGPDYRVPNAGRSCWRR